MDQDSSKELGLKDIIIYSWRCWQPFRIRGLALMGLILIDKLFWVVFALGLKYIVDHVDVPEHDQTSFWMIVAMFIVFPLISLVNIVSDKQMAIIRVRITNTIRRNLLDHLQSLSLNFFKHNPLGDLLARFAGDLDIIERVVSERFINSLVSVLAVSFNLVLLFYFNWYLTLGALLILSMAPLMVKGLSKKLTAATYEMYQSEAHIIDMVQENLRGQSVIKSFNLQQHASKTFGQRLSAFAGHYIDSFFLQALLEKGIILLVIYTVLLVSGTGLWLVKQQYFSAGALAAFLVILLATYKDLLITSNHVVYKYRGIGGLRRIQEVMNRKPHIVDSPTATDLSGFARDITFKKTAFTYSGNKFGLYDIDLSIPAGSNMAIVGPSGAGKSTLLGLMIRFFDVTGGSITIDGKDIRDVTRDSLRRQIGIVFQEPFLFDDTIFENIRLFDPVISEDQVKSAAQAAELHDFITHLPDGYQTLVGQNGSLLSSGERQRVTIARALCRHPSILLLDEVTASLDAKNAAAINATIASLARKHTVIAVTHDLKPASLSDRIVVLDRGRLVGSGTHEALLQQGGVYSRLWHKQQTSK